MAYVDQLANKVRKSPLGPVTLNQAHANIEAIDGLVLSEHFNDGQHNALEVPWVLGAVNSGTTGSLFNTAYGGGTIARPAVGRLTVSVAAGVVGEVIGPLGTDVPAAAVIANVNDAAIATYPHLVEAEMVSTTSVELRTRYMTSALGVVGNSWSAVAVGVDVALHAQKQPGNASLLASHILKARRDFLTEQATDWNALVGNQAIVRKALSLEHATDGAHTVNRIAKAWGWFKPATGPIFTIVSSEGVSSVSRVSAGVVEVTISTALTSTTLAACFPQAQPASADELVIVNGRCTSTMKFTFYIYVYSVSENKWTRDDRSFSVAMFGAR